MNLEQKPFFRFGSYLSPNTLDRLKEQVARLTRDQPDPLVDLFLSFRPGNNEIFLLADYSMNEFSLPQDFNTMYWGEDVFAVQVHVPFAIINGWAPVQVVSRGHQHVCLLQFDLPVPEIINRLPEVGSHTSSVPALILAKENDIK